LALGFIGVILIVGCAAAPPANQPHVSGKPRATAPTAAVAPSDKPLAFVNGQAVAFVNLRDALVESSGGQVLAEWIIDDQLRQRLASAGLTLAQDQLDAEKQVLLSALSTDADEAARLLTRLRERRGLGERRFSQLLWRNAALRALVRADPEARTAAAPSPAAIAQRFQLRYGPTYEARLIVVPTFNDAAHVIEQARAGASFTDLAIAKSTDQSRAQGGLLPPINSADATWPQAIRDALVKLEVGAVSDAVALEQGFAILRLERKNAPAAVKLDDVKDELTQQVRRDVEWTAMQQLTRAILADASVTILDSALAPAWNAQRRRVQSDE
jgi:parvulin-like peptidyl-prolyl isomerase